MDVIRRNTDYALRLIVRLVENFGKGPVSAKALAETADVSHKLSSKLLQRLCSAKLAVSRMGAGGGFELAKKPKKISLYQVVKAVQGGICLNRCVGGIKGCPRKQGCKIRKKLIALQGYIEDYLSDIKLDGLLKG